MRTTTLWIIGFIFCTFTDAAEVISIAAPGGAVRGTVAEVTKDQVTILTAAGKKMHIPLALLPTAEVYKCKRQLVKSKDAMGHFELGKYCLEKGLKKEAEEEFRIAVNFDKNLQEQVDTLLNPSLVNEIKVPPVNETAADNSSKKDQQADAYTEDKGKKTGDDEGEFVEVKGPNGQTLRVPKALMTARGEVKERSPEVMKKFLDDRLAELKKHIPGEWRQTESKNFYVISNIPPDWHKKYADYCEFLYTKLCEVMDHKDGDKLWNNKLPVYFFHTHRQFQTFATQIDGTAGGAMSGGYFKYRGRECHVAIPFYSERGEKIAMRTAMDTLFHETTHAFLQLSGNDVKINSWLHEGMAQFIEFWLDEGIYQNFNPDKSNRLNALKTAVQRGRTLLFEEGRTRPAGGMDTEGYAFAWSRVEFLYVYGLARNDYRVLPKLIKAIKNGKSEEEALKLACGMDIAQFDQAWRLWLDQAMKNNFKR